MQLRYWDGSTWSEEKRQAPIVSAGQKIQNVGDGIAKIGSSIIWIIVGIAILLFFFILL